MGRQRKGVCGERYVIHTRVPVENQHLLGQFRNIIWVNGRRNNFELSLMDIFQEFSFEDIKRLRLIVHKAHLRNYPDTLQTDTEADRIIESIAPDVLAGWLKEKIDRREIS